MKTILAAVTSLSLILSVSSALAADCTDQAAIAKAKRGAIALEQTNRNQTEISVVTAGVTMRSKTSKLVSVQVRGEEIGGNVWDITVNTNSCTIEKAEIGGPGLETPRRE